MKRIISLLSVILITAYLHAQTTIVKSPLYLYDYIGTVNDKMLFFATDGIDVNYELWISDGTPSGTQQLKDINPGTEGSILPNSYWGGQYSDKQPVIFNGELYFLAYEPLHGMEIWKSDGTPAGTVMLKDIHPGGEGYFSPEFNYPYFTEMDGLLYFAANDGTHGFELWKTNGTEAGTSMVKDISSDGIYGSNPEHLIVFKDKLYFTARDDVYGYEIYTSDGTGAGTEIITDIVPGVSGAMNDGYAGSIDPFFTPSGDYLYFIGRIDETLPIYYYLYRTDGTAAGTITLNNDLKDVAQLTDVDGTCFFYAFDGDLDHSALWKSDGSPGGTVNIPASDIFAYNNFYNFNNTLFFSGGNADYSDIGLYKSDGSAAGTALVKAFEGLGSFPEVKDYVSEEGSNSFFYRALFKITESSMDYRYVQTNGSTAGTKIFWNAAPFRAADFYNEKLYFSAIDSASGDWGLFSLEPVAFAPVAISGSSEQNVLNIFPNPAADHISVQIPGILSSKVTLEIFDMQGNKLYDEKTGMSSGNIDLQSAFLHEGIYLISLKADGVCYTNSIIISR